MTLFLSSGINHQVVDISRNYALRQQVDKVARLASNIEMSRRGYLLTLDETYLDLYRNTILSVDKTLADLEALTDQNPLQDARVKQIRALVEREQEDVRQTVNLAQSGDVAAAVEKVRGDEGKVLMDQLANTVTQFIDAEEQQLRAQQADQPHALLDDGDVDRGAGFGCHAGTFAVYPRSALCAFHVRGADGAAF